MIGHTDARVESAMSPFTERAAAAATMAIESEAKEEMNNRDEMQIETIGNRKKTQNKKDRKCFGLVR